MKERKVLDFDPGISPWEMEEIDVAEKIKDLQTNWVYRDRRQRDEEERKEKLAKQKITKNEEKKIEKKADEIKKYYVLDYWMQCFNKSSHLNPIAGQALFHVCLGQALNTFTIGLEDSSCLDWRLHFLWIQDSRTGKGKAMNFTNRIFTSPNFLKWEENDGTLITKRKYKTYKLGRMNPAALINTYKIDKNGKKKTDMNGIEEIKYGPMEKFDFIFAEEARAILESTNVGFDLQEIFMTAMETIGSSNNIYTKTLTDYEEICPTKSTSSFALTTRPFGKVKNTLVESGIIQRFMFYPRSVTYTQRKEMNKIASFAFKTSKHKTSFENDFKLLITELNKIVKFGFENFIDFDKDNIDNLLSFIHKKVQYWTDNVENTIPNEVNRSILQSFVGGYRDSMVIMAFHSAVMRFSKKVEMMDLQYAFNFFDQLYEAQKLWVSLTVEEDIAVKKEENEISKTLKLILERNVTHPLTLPEVVKKMAKMFRKDYAAMRYHIMKFTVGDSAMITLKENESNKRKLYVHLND